jgi:hypothetical protein
MTFYGLKKNFKSGIIVHSTQIKLFRLFFWEEICPKFEDENLSESFLADMELILKQRPTPEESGPNYRMVTTVLISIFNREIRH